MAVPTKEMCDKAALALASDPNSLADASGVEFRLYKENFTPKKDMDGSLLVEADYAGYAEITANLPNQVVQDPALGQKEIVLSNNSGGFKFIANGTMSGNQTIYGWGLWTVGGGKLLLSDLLSQPITLSQPGDMVDLDQITLRCALSPIT